MLETRASDGARSRGPALDGRLYVGLYPALSICAAVVQVKVSHMKETQP